MIGGIYSKKKLSPGPFVRMLNLSYYHLFLLILEHLENQRLSEKNHIQLFIFYVLWQQDLKSIYRKQKLSFAFLVKIPEAGWVTFGNKSIDL